MIIDEAVRLLRTYLIEVDPSTSSFTDDTLVLALSDALRVLQAKSVRVVDGLVLDPDVGIFAPEPSEQAGLVIVLKATVTILLNEYRGRLQRGEFGISWQSGLEQESSIAASKAYKDMVDDLSSELEQVVMISNVNFAALRAQ